MTNLEIIKYLATNNPTRLAELLDDLYCHAWNAGVYYAQDGKSPFEENDIDDFNKWFEKDAATTGLYYDEELEEWSKAINYPSTITAFYNGLSVTFPVKDPDYMWNNNNEYDYKEGN